MSKSNTKAIIDANIKQNGNQEITGASLNAVLNSMVNDYGTQDDLNGLKQKVENAETAVCLCNEEGFFVVDNGNHIGLKYDSLGLDVVKLSPHFLTLVGVGESPIAGDNSRQEILNIKQPSVSGGTGYMATVGVISDIHADGENLDSFINYCNFYGITNLLHLGDTTYEYNYGKTTSYAFWDSVSDSDKVMNVVGNHDSRTTSGGWKGQSQQVVYNCIIKPFVENVSPVQPENAETNGLNYYYKDLNNYVRLICLDCMFWGQDQYDWLSDVLDDSLANSKHILIAVHYPTNDINLADSSFNCRVAGAKIIDTSVGGNSYLDRYEPTNVSDLVQTFINNGGTFIAWMCGHQHRNWLGWLKRNPNQLQLCVPSSRKDYSSPTYAYELGNVNQHCFSIISVDAYAKTLKLLRIGKRTDTFMQYQKQFCYNYNTREIIYTD